MPNNPEQFIEEMIQAAQNRQDISVWHKHPDTKDVVNIVLELAAIPKRKVPMPELAKIQERILDRVAVPAAVETGIWASIPHFLKVGSAVLGSFLIVVSLTMGMAVAALQSVPGSAIYPLKKIVENIELRLAPEQDVASLQIQFAGRRMEEIQAVIEQQQQGELSNQQAGLIVSATVKDLQKSAAAAARSAKAQPKAAIVTKLADINNKLRIASIQSEGEVKIEIEKALQSTQDSQAEAIKNVQESGEIVPAAPDNTVTASGKLTVVSDTSVSIGTAKFLLTKDTKYINITASELKAGLVVDIIGQIKDNKTYADQITLVLDPKVSGESTVKTEIINPEIVPIDPEPQ